MAVLSLKKEKSFLIKFKTSRQQLLFLSASYSILFISLGITGAELNILVQFFLGDKRYECVDCGQKFSTSSHRLRHRREVHMGVKRDTIEYKVVHGCSNYTNFLNAFQ